MRLLNSSLQDEKERERSDEEQSRETSHDKRADATENMEKEGKPVTQANDVRDRMEVMHETLEPERLLELKSHGRTMDEKQQGNKASLEECAC